MFLCLVVEEVCCEQVVCVGGVNDFVDWFGSDVCVCVVLDCVGVVCVVCDDQCWYLCGDFCDCGFEIFGFGECGQFVFIGEQDVDQFV